MTARRVAFDVLRQVTGEDAYANLALAKRLARAGLEPRDAAFTTELVSGTSRLMGTYDAIIERAAGRDLGSLQPAVVDLLRLGSHQILAMDVPNRAAVAATVELARQTVGQRVTGLVNAILRKVTANDLDEWTGLLAQGLDGTDAAAVRGHHPLWIARAYADLLPAEELEASLAANNVAPRPTLVVRPGLVTREELVAAGAAPTRYSPFGAVAQVVPGRIPAVAEGRAGVQDEGSQLVAWALSRVDAPRGPWLDMCAGPGGKAALLTGLAREQGDWLLASDAQEHRVRLVAQSLRGYGDVPIMTADGTRPAWQPGSFARVMVDAPCSGLGALRRRPESRWRRQPSDVTELAQLQRGLLDSALDSTLDAGVVAYVTCSPHRSETTDIVEGVLAHRSDVEVLDASRHLPEVADAAVGNYLQLWPHRHGTDAMFMALLRRHIPSG